MRTMPQVPTGNPATGREAKLTAKDVQMLVRNGYSKSATLARIQILQALYLEALRIEHLIAKTPPNTSLSQLDRLRSQFENL